MNAQGTKAGAAERETPPSGVVHRFRIHRSDGTAEKLDWAALGPAATEPDPARWLWIHIDRADAEGRRWLETQSGLSEETVEALTSDDTRPRAAELDDGLLLILRGPNRDEADGVLDLVSIRLFLTERRVISVRLKPFGPSWDLAARYARGAGPRTPARFLDAMIDNGLAKLEEGLDWLGARVDEMEELALSEPTAALKNRRSQLNAVKRAVVARRRYLRPQQDALARLAALRVDWLPAEMRPGFSEAADQTGRIVEDLDELRERAGIIAEEMHARTTDRLNRTMVTLAIVSTVFLPLTVLTGLLGVNLAGIPFAEAPWAFGAFVASLLAVAIATMLAVSRITRL